MQRRADGSVRQIATPLFLSAAVGCAPTVNVIGVYFPGWLVSTVIGVVASYGIVTWLGRGKDTRNLANSGLLFVGLVVGIALAVWWVGFSGF